MAASKKSLETAKLETANDKSDPAVPVLPLREEEKSSSPHVSLSRGDDRVPARGTAEIAALAALMGAAVILVIVTLTLLFLS